MRLALATMPALSGSFDGDIHSELSEWVANQPWCKEALVLWFVQDVIKKSDIVDYDSESKKWHGIYTKIPIPAPREEEKKPKAKLTTIIEIQPIHMKLLPESGKPGMTFSKIQRMFSEHGIQSKTEYVTKALKEFEMVQLITKTIGSNDCLLYNQAPEVVE